MSETSSQKAQFMNKSKVERWTSNIAPKPSNYLHYYAKNANVAPNSLYQSIVSARGKIANQAIANIGYIASSSNFMARSTQIDSTTMKVAEELLTNNWLPEENNQVQLKGLDINPKTGDIIDLLSDLANNAGETENFMGVKHFTEALEKVLSKLLGLSENRGLASSYAHFIFEAFYDFRFDYKKTSTALAQKVIQQVLTVNNNQFFTIDQQLLIEDVDLDDIVHQISLMIAALPIAYTNKEFAKTSITFDSKEMSIKQALRLKLEEWMQVLQEETGYIANRYGAAKLLGAFYKDAKNLKYSIKTGADVIIREDPLISAHEELAKQAEKVQTNIQTKTLSVIGNENKVEGKFQIYTPDTKNTNDITLKTRQRTFNIIANESMLSVLMLHAGFTSSMIQDLIQILTYRDIGSAGYETRAVNTWEAIKNIVPYLVVINKLTNVFQTSGGLTNTFFAANGRVWSAREIFSHLTNALSSDTNNSQPYLVVSESGDLDRNVFVRINQFRRKYSSEKNEKDEYVRGVMIPNAKLAIERSKDTLAQSQNQLMLAKVSVKLRLSQLSQLIAGVN